MQLLAMQKPPASLIWAWLLCVAFLPQRLIAHAQPASAALAYGPAFSPQSIAIPFDQIGAVAGEQYSGDGLAVATCPEGARLRCVFQRLEAKVTPHGLWVVSIKEGASGQPFRVMAWSLGRAKTETLPSTGEVAVAGEVPRFVRPELTEEYAVGMDGVRQDFVIVRRPQGSGWVRLELEVDGAAAEAMAEGVRLALADGGRKLVYNRLKAEDARGRPLAAKFEVESASRLAVVLDDHEAQYPVRIDPTFSDGNWSSLFGMPGVVRANGLQVYAAAVDGFGNLYIGGTFTTCGMESRPTRKDSSWFLAT